MNVVSSIPPGTTLFVWSKSIVLSQGDFVSASFCVCKVPLDTVYIINGEVEKRELILNGVIGFWSNSLSDKDFNSSLILMFRVSYNGRNVMCFFLVGSNPLPSSGKMTRGKY